MKTKDEVQLLLEKHSHLKDSDNKLICTFWFNEMKHKGLDPHSLSCMDFMELIAESKLTNAKTIRRYRALLQEKHISLRGQAYVDRQTVKQDIVKSNLGYEKNN